MGKQYFVSAGEGRKSRLAIPVLGVSALILTGCSQLDQASAQEDTDWAAVEEVSLYPAHGDLKGGNLVLVDTGAVSEKPVTAWFGELGSVDCTYDSVTAMHACTAPANEILGTVDVNFAADGTPLPQTTTYTYTSDGSQDMPMLTVDTDMVHSHAELVRGAYPPDVQLGAVLKNGEPVDVFGQVIDEAASPDYFFVPKLEDAIALRDAGIESKIAVMYVSQVEDIPLMLHYDIEATAADLAWVEAADEMASRSEKTLRVHQWIDTGLGREGVTPSDALPLAQAIEESDYLELIGIATHFSTITENDAQAIEENDTSNVTVVQKTRFDEAVAQIRDAGFGEDALIHAGASDVLNHQIEPLFYDLMRIGGAFFGGLNVEDRVYSWTTELEQIKTLPVGWCIDYDCTEPTEEEMTVGLINHIPRREVDLVFTVNDVEVPVLLHHGTVVTLDLSQVPDAAVGDAVEIDFDPNSFFVLDGTAPLPVTAGGA